MSEEDQSVGNNVDGVVNGTSFQAGSVSGDVYVNTHGKHLWRRRSSYLAVLAGAVVGASVLAVVTLVAPDEQAAGTPAVTTTPPETPATSSPASAPGTPAPPTVAGAARPAPPGATPRPTAKIPDTSAPATTTVVISGPPPPATGVRFSGELRFGSFHLDLAQPRDVPGTNVWPLAPDRLHGDDGYWLAEWLGDGVPGQAECVAELGKRATRDAEHLIIGSRVCGKTPAGRTFLVDVTVLDGSAITGRVTVWD